MCNNGFMSNRLREELSQLKLELLTEAEALEDELPVVRGRLSSAKSKRFFIVIK